MRRTAAVLLGAFASYRDAEPQPYVEILRAGKAAERSDCAGAFVDNIVSADVLQGR